MFVVRPIVLKDLEQLLELSSQAGAGLTSLPPDRSVLQAKIKESAKNFEYMVEKPNGEIYLFAIEDLKEKKIVGTTAVYSKVGGFEPFYTYKIKTVTKESQTLDVKHDIQYLELIKDHDGPSEIGTLFLAPEYRKHGNGRLLSLCRFLFMAQYRACFEDKVIAEMRGVIDENDRSPFWEALGHHFFKVEFKNADMMVLRDKSFIADLMPHHPIYISLLPFSAQAVIGKVHANTEPALHMLLKEGFVYSDEIDIFEAGPVVRCRTDKIRTVRESRQMPVKEISSKPIDSPTYLIANINEFKNFRVAAGNVGVEKEGVRISKDLAKAIQVKRGAEVRFSPLKAGQAHG